GEGECKSRSAYEDHMKHNLPACITAMVFTALAITAQVAAQKAPRYKLIDLGTLGGPNSSEGPRFPIVNSRGVVAGASDTLLTDPNCVFRPNCLDLHATQWSSGRALKSSTWEILAAPMDLQIASTIEVRWQEAFRAIFPTRSSEPSSDRFC